MADARNKGLGLARGTGLTRTYGGGLDFKGCNLNRRFYLGLIIYCPQTQSVGPLSMFSFSYT